MSILSFFKNLFGKTEEVTVSIKVTEKPVVVSAPKVEKQKENLYFFFEISFLLLIFGDIFEFH